MFQKIKRAVYVRIIWRSYAFSTPFDESNTVPVEHIVVTGVPAEPIAKYAQKFGMDLVVLGSPENELTEEDFGTSTVLQMISKVKCPVLCLPSIKTSAISLSDSTSRARSTREFRKITESGHHSTLAFRMLSPVRIAEKGLSWPGNQAWRIVSTGQSASAATR